MSHSKSKFHNHKVKAQEVFTHPDVSDQDVSPPDFLDRTFRLLSFLTWTFLSCMVVDLLCVSVVRSLTSWYAFLLLFFLRHASTLPEYGPCSLYTRIRAVRPSTCNVVRNAFWHLNV